MHPSNRLALWVWVVSLLPWLERQFLYGAAVALIGMALFFARNRFIQTLPRIRWLLLALGCVYGWTTPGEYFWPGWLSPTREGIWLGGAQMTRLLAIAASLQLLLVSMDRSAIFAGLHSLAKPLNLLGFSRDRAALRLTLTLEMTEKLLAVHQPLRQLWQELRPPMNTHIERIVSISVRPMNNRQSALLLLQSIVLAATIWLGGSGTWT